MEQAISSISTNNLGSYKKKVQNAKRNRRGGVSPPVVGVGRPNPYKNSVSVARFLNMSHNLFIFRHRPKKKVKPQLEKGAVLR